MEIVAALLRSVNVGGRAVKMDRLRDLFEGMGFRRVQTYIQSGNVMFLSPEAPDASIRQRIEAELAQALGFDVAVILLTAAELGDMLRECPYSGEGAYATVLQEPAQPEALHGLAPVPGSDDAFTAAGRAVYVQCRHGYHETAYSNAFFERKLKTKATTRRIDTLVKFTSLAAQMRDSE